MPQPITASTKKTTPSTSFYAPPPPSTSHSHPTPPDTLPHCPDHPNTSPFPSPSLLLAPPTPAANSLLLTRRRRCAEGTKRSGMTCRTTHPRTPPRAASSAAYSNRRVRSDVQQYCCVSRASGGKGSGGGRGRAGAWPGRRRLSAGIGSRLRATARGAVAAEAVSECRCAASGGRRTKRTWRTRSSG
ncbi:hypothetical protein VTK26DRAFT_4212 [Humicola hyalothermophila]